MKKVPKRRFKGFLNAGDWEQRKLGEVANIKTGSRNQQDSVTNGQYPFFIRSEKIEKLDTYDFDTEAILVPGDGRIGEIFHYYNGKFALHQRVYKIDDFKGIDAFYLLYLFQYRFKEHALRLNAQGTVPSLRLPMFTEWDLCIPSLQEQGCIGRFLNKIELIITLHQRKLEKLQATKKALLYELFPIENSRRPKLRFKGFTGDWEQRKLGELLEQPITDGPHETPELYDSGIPFISVDAIVDNKIDFTKMRGYISKEYDDICAKKYKPQINDVYLVKSGATIGKVAIVDTYDDFNIWSPLAAMRCGSITNPYFLYVLLQTKDLQTQVFNKASHGTQPNLSMRQLETFTCKVPKIEEQILISQFFKRLNDSITLHQRKLDKLKNLKAAYLNEMFV